MYAIIKAGGKQYQVSPGDVVRLEKLSAEPGSEVEFKQVLAIRNQGLITGNPILESAVVRGTVISHGRDAKVRVLKYKRKKQYRRTLGHRQAYSAVRIKEIVAP